jgi:NAD(P)-dependent dehydrogenase (short-subunit alcohol dehydrogenase family)
MKEYMPAIKDKVVVVTGSTRGYGYAIAESLLEAGAAVAVTGRTQQAIDRAVASLQPKGRVSGFVLDVRNEDQVYKLVEDVLREFGRIDIWVNNAGYSNSAGMMLDESAGRSGHVPGERPWRSAMHTGDHACRPKYLQEKHE